MLQVEFESGPETVSKVRPWNIFDNSTDLVYLSQESPITDVNSKVPQPGQYVFIVQYYQPDAPGKLSITLWNFVFIFAFLFAFSYLCPFIIHCRVF